MTENESSVNQSKILELQNNIRKLSYEFYDANQNYLNALNLIHEKMQSEGDSVTEEDKNHLQSLYNIRNLLEAAMNESIQKMEEYVEVPQDDIEREFAEGDMEDELKFGDHVVKTTNTIAQNIKNIISKTSLSDTLKTVNKNASILWMHLREVRIKILIARLNFAEKRYKDAIDYANLHAELISQSKDFFKCLVSEHYKPAPLKFTRLDKRRINRIKKKSHSILDSIKEQMIRLNEERRYFSLPEVRVRHYPILKYYDFKTKTWDEEFNAITRKARAGEPLTDKAKNIFIKPSDILAYSVHSIYADNKTPKEGKTKTVELGEAAKKVFKDILKDNDSFHEEKKNKSADTDKHERKDRMERTEKTDKEKEKEKEEKDKHIEKEVQIDNQEKTEIEIGKTAKKVLDTDDREDRERTVETEYNKTEEQKEEQKEEEKEEEKEESASKGIPQMQHYSPEYIRDLKIIKARLNYYSEELNNQSEDEDKLKITEDAGWQIFRMSKDFIEHYGDYRALLDVVVQSDRDMIEKYEQKPFSNEIWLCETPFMENSIPRIYFAALQTYQSNKQKTTQEIVEVFKNIQDGIQEHVVQHEYIPDSEQYAYKAKIAKLITKNMHDPKALLYIDIKMHLAQFNEQLAYKKEGQWKNITGIRPKDMFFNEMSISKMYRRLKVNPLSYATPEKTVYPVR